MFVQRDSENGTDMWDKGVNCAVPRKTAIAVWMQITVPGGGLRSLGRRTYDL